MRYGNITENENDTSALSDGAVAFNFVHSLKYALKTMRRAKFLRALMLVLCSVSIALAACISGMGDGLVNHQAALLRTISDREVFLINFTAPLQTYVDVDEHLSISDNDAAKIGEISSIETYYPYLEFRSLGYDIDNDTMFDSCELTVTTDIGISAYSFNTKTENYWKVIIAPYYEEDAIDKRVIKTFENNSDDKIYLSYELASSIGLINSECSSAQISAGIGIPVGTTPVDLNVSSTESLYKADIDVSTVRQVNFEVAGILDHDFTNRHSTSGNVIVYMPIKSMLSFIASTKETVDAGAFDKDYEINDWKPSAYIAFVKDYNDISSTIEKLEKINPNFKAISGYQDVDSMNEMLSNVRYTASWIIIAVLVIIFVLMAVIYINNTVGRKYEFALLKANGLNNKEILGIAFSEALIQLICIILLALLAAILTSKVVNMLFNFDVLTLSVKTLIVISATALVAVLTPTVGSIIIMNRVRPDRVLRN